MLTITDYGCDEHQSCQVTFEGMQATMMENLIANLPMIGSNYTYICAYGRTHRVLRHLPQQEKVTTPSGYMRLS